MQKSLTTVLCPLLGVKNSMKLPQNCSCHIPAKQAHGKQTRFFRNICAQIHSQYSVIKVFETYLGSLGSAGKMLPVRLQLKKPPTANTPIIMISMTVNSTATAATKDRKISKHSSNKAAHTKEPSELTISLSFHSYDCEVLHIP